MTAASGGPGETPGQHYGQTSGGYEAPPIEHTPAYLDYPVGDQTGGYPYPPPPPPGFPPPAGFGPPGYAPGYPPPGYPQYPPPEYGGPYPIGYGYPPPGQSGTSVLAIISLIASVLWVCGLGSVVGIALGAVAINQVKRSGQSGFGLAVAGIVIGVAGLAVTLISITFSSTYN